MRKIRFGPHFVFFPKRDLAFLLLVLFYLPACKVRIKPPPTTAACTFTINGIFSSCHNPLSSSKTLAYKLNFTVFYFNGSDKITLDNQTFTSSASNPSSTLTVTSKLPNNGYNWSVEVTVTGTQCSTCALTQYGGQVCIQYPVSGGTHAAIPVLHYAPGETVGYFSSRTINLSLNNRVANYLASCGCTVPN